MLILWRYLLKQYLKVFCLATIAFIAILLVTRLNQIARVTVLGVEGWNLVLFILYQLPYILPIAIPVSSLISAVILFQGLSHTHELTAMRACGLSLRRITAPILIVSAALSLVNAFVTSELATESHLASRQLIYKLSTGNPLLLFQNSQLLKLKDTYVDMRVIENGERAEDFLLASYNRNNGRLALIIAKNIALSSDLLVAKEVSLISGIRPDSEGTITEYDNRIIENHKVMSSGAKEASNLLKRSEWRLNNDHLKMRLLLFRAGGLRKDLQIAKEEASPSSQIYEIKKSLNLCYSDISRRISIALAVFTFTLMGTAFGIQISRDPSKKGLFAVLSLATLFLICFFSAKGLEQIFWLATTLYMAPHLLILALSFWTLKRVSQGATT